MNIEIEKPTDETAAKNVEAKEQAMKPPDEKKVTWQFRYTNYQEILPFVDDTAEPSFTGRRPNATIKARNYRLEFDLTDSLQKRKHEALLQGPGLGQDYWLLTNAKKKQKISEQGATLKKLMEMPEAQLRGMLSDDEMLEAGLLPTADRFDIAMAVINSANKRLVGKEGEKK
jgi:hypothetical protein